MNPAALALRMTRPSLVTGGDWGRWRADPAAFARENFGMEFWDAQIRIAEAIRAHSRVAVRTGHKTGKSSSAAAIALWWVCAHPRGRVVMTSSSARQVKNILWHEVRTLWTRSRALDKRQRRADGRPRWEAAGFPAGEPALDPETGIRSADGRFVVGFTAGSAEKMAGTSGDQLLYIADEASGIGQETFEAIEGNRAGGARLLLLGNPTRTVGEFFDAFNSKRSFYRLIHVSSETTPNAVTGKTIIPGLAERSWVDEKRLEWGEDSPLFQVRVRGDFPRQSDMNVIALGDVEAAVERWKVEDLRELEDGPLVAGLDVARFGDDESVLAVRRGHRVVAIRVWRGLDGPDLANAVALEVGAMLRPGDGVVQVLIDGNGVGASAFDAMRRLPKERGLQASSVNVSTSPTATSPDEPAFLNLRAQLHFAARDWLREGGAIPDDDKLIQELLAPVFSFDGQNRLRVESKDEIRCKLTPSRSPDRADALMLTFAPGAAQAALRARVGRRTREMPVGGSF